MKKLFQPNPRLFAFKHIKIMPTLPSTQLFATKLLDPGINTCFVSLSRGLFLTCRGELYKNILTACTQSTLVWQLNQNKEALTSGNSPLRQDAKFPPHQSHAGNHLPLYHQPFQLSPLPPNIPVNPSSTHVIYWQKMTFDLLESSYVQHNNNKPIPFI